MTKDSENSKDDERRSLVRNAAFDVFTAYGFKRTSMEDIANAAGVSRPALYQTFANKNDIFRALIEKALQDTSVEAEACLAEEMPLHARLKRLLEILVLEPHRMVHSYPHGEELLGLKAEIAADLFQAWEDRNKQIFERVFANENSAKHELNAPLAHTIAFAIAGMKAGNMHPDDMERELEGVINVILAAKESS